MLAKDGSSWLGEATEIGFQERKKKLEANASFNAAVQDWGGSLRIRAVTEIHVEPLMVTVFAAE